MINEKRKLKVIVVIFILLVVVGTLGYKFLLNVSFVDALYMTIITISTVGYTEVGQMNPAAKLFSIIIIFWGVGIVGYTFTSIVVLFVEGKIREVWRGRMATQKIAQLNEHYILCGCGNTGEVIVEEFLKQNIPFVVIDERLETCQDLMERNILVLHGDPTEENILLQARVQVAKGMISAMSTDMQNIVAVLTARDLNPDLYIISKAIDKHAPSKLVKAGANNTLSMTEIGGHRMAALMLRPDIICFLDVITHMGDKELDLENVMIMKGSRLDGKNLREADIPRQTGLVVFAIKSSKLKKMNVNPSPDYQLELGDSLIVLGMREQIDKLKVLAEG